MHSEFFDCSICINRYNSIDRLPKILPSCGHTICSSCLNQILQSQHVTCPLDRKPLDRSLKTIDAIPTNILILQMLDSKSSAQYNNCPVHKEPLSLYCLVDKSEICRKCANEKSHKGHNVQSITEILSKAATKKNRLKGMLSDFEGEVHTVHTLLEDSKKNTLAIMKDKFAKIRDLIYKKEQEISLEIDMFFTQEKLRVESQIQHDLSIRDLIRNKINNLGQFEINEKLLKELDDDSHSLNFSSSNQYNAVYSHSKKIQQNIEDAFNTLISFAGSVIQEFKPLPETFRSQAQQQVVDMVLPIYKNLRIEIEFGWLVVYPLMPEENQIQVERNNMLNLSKCKELAKVCLDFRKQKLCNEMIVTIAQLWKELSTITSVKLLLTNKNFNNQDLCDLCSYNFWCEKQVQALYMYLITTKINETGVKKLAEVIDGRNIRTFALDCSYSSLTDNCMKEISNILVWKLQNVESFELRISNTAVSDVGLEGLFKELAKVTSRIKLLDLWLDFTNIRERGFDYFNKGLLPLAKNMTNLNIHCPKYEGPAGNFIHALMLSIDTNLPKLKQLELYFEKRGLTEQTKAYIEEFKKKNFGKFTTNF